MSVSQLTVYINTTILCSFRKASAERMEEEETEEMEEDVTDENMGSSENMSSMGWYGPRNGSVRRQ